MGKIGWGTNLHAHGDGGDGVHLAFDPGSDRVGLFGELAAQHLVVLLLAQLGLQRAVALRHQLAHLGPLGRDVLRWPPPNHDTPTEKSHKKKEEEEKTTSVAAPNGRPAAQAVADQKTGAVPWATSSPLDGWVCWFVFGLVGWFWLVFGIGWFKRAASGLAISGPNKSIGAASVVANQSRVIDNDKNQTKKQTKKDQTHARTR